MNPVTQSEIQIVGQLQSQSLLPLTELGVQFFRAGELVQERVLEENVPVQVAASLLESGVTVPLLELDLEQGDYQVQLYAVDAVAEARSDLIDFSLAWPAPLSLELISPVEGGVHAQPVMVSVMAASDPELPLSVFAEIADVSGGASVPLELTREGTSYSGLVSVPGDYILTVRAEDGINEPLIETASFTFALPMIPFTAGHDH